MFRIVTSAVELPETTAKHGGESGPMPRVETNDRSKNTSPSRRGPRPIDGERPRLSTASTAPKTGAGRRSVAALCGGFTGAPQKCRRKASERSPEDRPRADAPTTPDRSGRRMNIDADAADHELERGRRLPVADHRQSRVTSARSWPRPTVTEEAGPGISGEREKPESPSGARTRSRPWPCP